MTALFSLKSVRKTFGDTMAVDGIDLNVYEGECLVLLGTSGCGKTTTLRLMNRLIEPDAGQIFFQNQDITLTDPVALRRKIGYVIQQVGLFPHRTVAENIATVPELLGLDAQGIARRTAELLEMIDLDADTYSSLLPGQLSGGQQQRVGFARALAADPPVILMDEPFGALDPKTRIQIRQQFQSVARRLSKTVVLVTHDISEALELGDRIVLMDKGRIVQAGSPRELLFRPVEDFTKEFFADQKFAAHLQVLKAVDLIAYLTNPRVEPGQGEPGARKPPAGERKQSGEGAIPILDGECSLAEILQASAHSKAFRLTVDNATRLVETTELLNAYHAYLADAVPGGVQD